MIGRVHCSYSALKDLKLFMILFWHNGKIYCLTLPNLLKQVLASDADDIFGDYKKTRVVVKLLKDDANHADRHLFLEEMVPYKFVYFSISKKWFHTSSYISQSPRNGSIQVHIFLNIQEMVPYKFVYFLVSKKWFHTSSYIS